MKSEKYLDYGITLLLIIVVVALVYVSSHKVKEDFTELFFNEHLNLPKYVRDSGTFTFAIHNMENRPYAYDVLVSAEVYNNTNETEPFNVIDLNMHLVTLEDNETRIFAEDFKLPRFEKAKIRVLIKNETQDIHFWTFYAREFLKYDGIGYGMLDCLKTVSVPSFSQMQVIARGSYANGWPRMQLWFDGILNKEIDVSSPENAAYFFDVNGSKGNHVVDIAFVNDYSNKTVGDRNLYIQKIILGEQEILSGNFTRDSGSKEKMVDCQNLGRDGNLYSNSAARLKLNVN